MAGASSGILATLGTCVVWLAYGRSQRTNPLHQKRALAAAIRTTASIFWPVVLFAMVPQEDHDTPVLIYPLLWNILLWCVDSALLHHSPSGVDGEPASLMLEPVSLTGLTFGICTLMRASDGKYAHLFLYAVLGCLLVVTPSHSAAPGSITSQLFVSIQKAFIMWCLGTLVAAVALTRRAQIS